MLRVIENHRRAAYDAEKGQYVGLDIKPVGIDAKQFQGNSTLVTTALLDTARQCWDRALHLGQQFGYRNAQSTVIAPTGTIGLLMDCDTTGVEPDFALVKFKKLAGGGYFKIVNQSVDPRAAQPQIFSESAGRRTSSRTSSDHSRSTNAPHINAQIA